MSKLASQSSAWNFSVVQRQLRHPLNHTPLPMYGNFREDTEDCLGVTSEQYGIIQNSVLMDAARAALEARGLSGYQEHIMSAGECGQRFYAEFTFKERQIASRVGDYFGYKLILKNSFDRSLRASISLGFLRLACLNGMATLTKEFSVTKKHSSKISVDFLGGAIDDALRHSSKALDVYDTLAGVPLSDEQGVNILGRWEKDKTLSGSLREPIQTLWLHPKRQEDAGRTLYSLYNAITEYLTHEVARDRFEYAGKVSNGLLMRLFNAAHNREMLAKMILPVVDAEIVEVESAD